MKPFSIVLLALLLAGCATPKVYGEVGAGYKILSQTDQLLHPKYGGGRNPTAHFEIGVEWKNKARCGLHHFSHWRDGSPFNNNPETWKNEIKCMKKWGGH